MPKVAIVTDSQGWIVDRISRIYQRYIPGVEIFYLAEINLEVLIHIHNHFNLIHFNNFFVRGMQPFFESAKIPTIVSIRSFRFSEDIPSLTPSLFHVIHPDLVPRFGNAVFIPDGIDLDFFKPDHKFRVGMACQQEYRQFKGLDLLIEAAKGLDVEVVHAADLPHSEMRSFYQSLDLYVCASETEGHSAPVVECMALNIPVISTNTGVASYVPGIHVVERSVEGIRNGLLAHIGRYKVQGFAWPIICQKVREMYQALLGLDRWEDAAPAAADRPYSCVIDRNVNRMNDQIFDAVKPMISGRWLDVGANIGVLLEEVPNGVGVDASQVMVAEAQRRGRDVRLADARQLPFADKEFDTVVLSCVLEQIPDWKAALAEAKRVGRRVVGINPIPGSQWGVIQGAVKAIIPPEEMGGRISYPDIDGKYLFEIECPD